MCGLFGVIKVGKPKEDLVKRMIQALADASEDRGTDAGGISYYFNDKLQVVRNKGAITKNSVLSFDEAYSSPIIMGHTRASTQGIASINENNHPFPSELGTFTLAHNGILYNDDSLAKEHDLSHPKITTDTYVAVQLLDKLHNGVINEETLKDLGERVGGTFNFTLLDEYKNLWIVKHNNPLVMWYIHDLQMLVYASTGEILREALDNFYSDFMAMLVTRKRPTPFADIIDIDDGEILKIDVNAQIQRFKYEPEDKAVYIPVTRYTNHTGSFNPLTYDEDSAQEELEAYYRTYYDSSLNMSEFLDFRVDMSKVVFFNGYEEEVSIPMYGTVEVKGPNFGIYSQLKSDYLSLPLSHLLGIFDGNLLLSPYKVVNLGVPITDDNGYNIISKIMGELKNTPEWVTILASIDYLKELSLELYKEVKETIVSSMLLNFLYNNFMPEINGNQPIKPTYDYSELKYVVDYLDVLLFASTMTSGYVNPKDVYSNTHVWATYYMNFLNEGKGGI